jgi:hypothetical protein
MKAPLRTSSFYQLHEMGFNENTLDWLYSCLVDGFHSVEELVESLQDYDSVKALEVSQQYSKRENVLVLSNI